jgi:hypothetical protein
LIRGPIEPVDEALCAFYNTLLGVVRRTSVSMQSFTVLPCARAWHDNASSERVVAFTVACDDGARCVVAVNYANHRSQCYVKLDGIADVTAVRQVRC